MSVKYKSFLELQALDNATTDTDRFLVSDGGIVKYRTGAEMLSDLGVAPGVASNIQHQVKAGVAINKGQAVYVTGADGTNMIVGLASNAAEVSSSKTMGLMGSTVAINGFGSVIAEGLLAGLNTSTANAGDPVWLGTGGNLIYGIVNKPYAPSHLVFIGIVTRVNANNGEIFVKVQNGFELDELHDVDLKTTTPISGHILGHNGTLWVNKTIAGWLGYTPQSQLNGTGFVKISGTTISYDNSTYALDSAVVHLTGNETVAGVKTFTNTGNSQTNGVRFINNGVAASFSLYTNNSDAGYGVWTTNGGSGTGLYSQNSGTGNAIVAENVAPNGIALKARNQFGGKGIELTNEGAGLGLIINNLTAATGMPFSIQKNGTNKFTINDAGDATATKFVKSGGTSTQFLKADGSVDSTTYVSSSALAAYLPLTGGTLTGVLNGTRASFSQSSAFDTIYGYNGAIGGTAINGGAANGTSAYFVNNSTTYPVLKVLGLSGTTLIEGRSTSDAIIFSVTSAGIVTGSSFVKSGGTAAQILAANGTVITAGTGITISGGVISSTGSSGVTSFNTRTGAVTLTSADVTTALGYTPYNSSNPAGYITSAGSSWYSSYSGTADTLDGYDSSAFLRYYGINAENNFQKFQDNTGEVRFDQINDYNNLDNPPGGYNYGGVLSLRGDSFGFQLWGSHTGDLFFKTQWNDDQYSGWREILNSGNYNSYSPTLSGGNASGTWGINITGNASSVNTTYVTTNADYYLTFVDSNNGSPSAEFLYTIGTVKVNPNTGRLTATSYGGAGTGLTGTASSLSIGGNAGTATTLQTARNINGTSFNGSANIDTTEWFHSDRDFPNGTLITTSINYANSEGDPFILEIRGNTYGNIIPHDIQVQGYIYSNTIINVGGLSNGRTITGLVALNVGGNLCFWFPNQGYWNGYNVKAYTAYATRAVNKVTSITGQAKPSGTKEVDLSSQIRQSLHSDNYTSYAVPTTRTITINGTTLDLSANRSWTITANTVETDTLATVTARGNTTTTSIRAERYIGNNSLILNSYTTVNPASNVFLYSQPNDRDSWLYLDSADTGSNWGIYHRQIDSAVSGLEGNAIGFIGGGNSALKASIGLSTGNGYFAGTLNAVTLQQNGTGVVTNNGGTWGINITGSSSSANSATYASYLPNAYIGGVQSNPQAYFNYGIGLKVAMTGSWSTWSDTLWINGYSGADVPNMCALHFLRNGQPRMAISAQTRESTSYGTYYEVITAYNIASQTVASAGNATTAGGLAVHANRNNEANKIVRTDASGYIQAGWINTTSGSFGSAINKIYCSDDDYMRYQTPASFISNLGLITTSSIGSQSVNYASSAGSVAWGNVSSKPSWMTSASLVASHPNANDWRNSGFYENDGGGSNWPSGTWYNSINVRHSNQGNYHGFQVAMSFYDNLLWFRSYQGSGTFQSWAYAISSQNIGSQSVNYANSAGSTGSLDGYTWSSAGKMVRGSDFYTDGWFRNYNNNQGLYNQANGTHFYSHSSEGFAITGSGGIVQLQFRSNHQSTLRGYVYGDTSSNFGLLNDQGGWSVKCYAGSGYGGALSGTWTASGDLVAYSDVRVKENVKTIENALDKVLSLRGVEYNRTDTEDKTKKIGVIAQEIQKILPEVVQEQEDGMLGVSYGNIVGILIEAIKEQQKQIDDLKTKLGCQ